MDKTNKLVVFQDTNIRREWYKHDWYFSIIDIIGVLTDSENPRKYWSVLKTRLKQEGNELATICSQLTTFFFKSGFQNTPVFPWIWTIC